jgi:hypothetical protein
MSFSVTRSKAELVGGIEVPAAGQIKRAQNEDEARWSQPSSVGLREGEPPDGIARGKGLGVPRRTAKGSVA